MALPSLRQLRYLVALAERLNFRAAAEDSFVTQSTLSAGIKELEAQLEKAKKGGVEDAVRKLFKKP